MLELRSVTKSYMTASLTQVALNEVSLAFRDNEFVAILGQSGSGKTTMLNVIGGLDHFDSGDLVIDGISTKDYRDRDWDTYRNNRIGFVFQSYNLIPHQSVIANVELALTLSGVSRGERRKRALKALEDVGLKEHAYKQPAQLSGGQMQRVAIARALVNDPEIVLADEPTGALDSQTSIQVMDLLRDVARERLVVMVTHNPELAHEYATRIVELADGRIIADSQPFVPGTEDTRSAKSVKKTSMSFLTALSLSANNLMTKKGRTLMTSFAGSIGIIGIASILALANGANDYISRTEEEALTSYPLSIQQTGFDMSSMIGGASSPQQSVADEEQSGTGERVNIRPTFSSMMDSTTNNDLKSLKRFFDNNGGDINSYVSAIEYSYAVTPQIYQVDTSRSVVRVNPEQSFSTMNEAYGSGAFSSFVQTDAFSQLPDNPDLYRDKYTLVRGSWPVSSDELVLVLDADGSIPDYLVYTLGLREHTQLDEMMNRYYSGQLGTRSGGEDRGAQQPQSFANDEDNYSFDDIVGITFSRVNAADRYSWDETYRVWTDRSNDSEWMKTLISQGQKLKISGIVQANDSNQAPLSNGLGYTAELTKQIIREANNSTIIRQQLESPEKDVLTGKTFAQLQEEARNGENSGFDMSQLLSIDEQKLQAAFAIDPQLLNMDLTGLDFSSLTLPSMDFSSVPGLDLTSVDMSVLLSNLDITQLNFQEFNGVDFQQIAPQLAQINVAQIIESALADGVIQPQAGEELARLSAELAQGFIDYAREHSGRAEDADGDGIPDVDIEQLVSAYFTSEQVQDALSQVVNSGRVINQEQLMINLAEALGQDAAVRNIAEQYGRSLAEYIGSQLATNMSTALSTAVAQTVGHYLTGALSQSMTSLMQQVQAQIASGIEQVMGQFVSTMSQAMNIDPQALTDAFKINTSEEELAALMSTMMTRTAPSYESNLRMLGWGSEEEPSQINIYPTSFEDKDQVKEILDEYNRAAQDAGHEAQIITYTDMVGLLMSQITRIIDIISWMLIAFVSISLVVSSIMIAIITYISVLERKKEIGILRSIGASKGDISRVFNAETVIEGFLAGIIGVAATLGLSLVANIIVSGAFNVDNIAQLPLSAALTLIGISIALTLVAGIIPAGRASTEDPVEALRAQ